MIITRAEALIKRYASQIIIIIKKKQVQLKIIKISILIHAYFFQ